MQPFKGIFNTIFTKFALSFIAVGLLPLGILTWVVLGRIPVELEKYTINNLQQLMLYTGSNVRKTIDDYDNSTKLLYRYSSGPYGKLDPLLRQASRGTVGVEANEVFKSLLSTVLQSGQYIERAFLLDAEGRILNVQMKSSNLVRSGFSFADRPFFRDVVRGQKGLFIESAHDESYLVRSKNQVISLARNYLDLEALPVDEIVTGTLVLDVNIDVFTPIFKRLSLDADSRILILDADGRCLYSQNRAEIGADRKSLLELADAAILENRSYAETPEGYLFHHRIEEIGWTIVDELPRIDLVERVLGISQFIRILLVVCAIGLMAVSAVFSRSLTRPIRSVIAQMKKVESGNLDIQVEVSSHDEVRQLAETFNNMTSELNGYIRKAYVAQIRQKEAELTAIRTQISPHYLYNTLEVIRMKSLDEEAPLSADMILALSDQLKYVIGYKDDTVPLWCEVDNVASYFAILKVRFEERFSLETDIPQALMDLRTPKLILQPIVENAVNHGLRPKTGRGKVLIKARLREGTLEISVFDDGIGMTEETLTGMQVLLEGEEMGRKNGDGRERIGIKNVHDRIRLRYGAPYGIKLTSRLMLGTVVTLTMPEEGFCQERSSQNAEDSAGG